jgi:transketolase
MRDEFSAALVRLARSDARVVLLTGDHGYALFDEFRLHCPSQYINAGIAEQNMVGMAAGLARTGFRPVVYGLSAFVPIRVLEQIKLDVAHDNLPVIFIGDGAGFVYSHLGTSHQSLEDIACTRVIPNLSVYSPADRTEMALCMRLAYNAAAPVYLRMGKSDKGDAHSQTAPGSYQVGDLLSLIPPSNFEIAFIATGSLLTTAIEIASTCFPGAGVWSAPTIKPIAVEQVTAICKGSKVVVVLEVHSVLGGLGSIVAEISSEFAPVRVLRIGVNDCFSQHCGTYEYLLQEHKLNRAAIEERIQQFRAAV